jgi:hypothetical protein
LPAVFGVFFYFARLIRPNRRKFGLHLAGGAALLLAILELIGAFFWMFYNGMNCID